MSEETEKMESELNPLQEKFVEFYLGKARFNGTEAARLAGYKGNRNTLGVTAYHLLRNPKIKTVLEAALSAQTLSANAVLTRLTEIANLDIQDLTDEKGNFDFKKAKKAKKTHLIKKLKTKRTIRETKTEINEEINALLSSDEAEKLTNKVEVIYEEIEFETYSAHEALRDLGKHHKLFTDKIEQDVNLNTTVVRVPPKMTPEEWSNQFKSEK